jgi:hypothetical protein
MALEANRAARVARHAARSGLHRRVLRCIRGRISGASSVLSAPLSIVVVESSPLASGIVESIPEPVSTTVES